MSKRVSVVISPLYVHIKAFPCRIAGCRAVMYGIVHAYTQHAKGDFRACAGMSGEGLRHRSARGPLECLNGNAHQAAEHEGTKQGSTGNTGSKPRKQGKAHAPAVKRIARPRGAGHVDFGVQIFAKPPPPLQDSCQVCLILHTDHDDLTRLPSGWAWPPSIA